MAIAKRQRINLKSTIVKNKNIIQWLLRLIAAVIMLQTLYFKFTAQPESVTLFTTLGIEPWGRIGTGIMELLASILILIPRTTLVGAFLGTGLMSGAIFFHLTRLGIDFGGDSTLFIYAVTVWVACVFLILLNRKQIPSLLKLKLH